jgi:hypothetical protein
MRKNHLLSASAAMGLTGVLVLTRGASAALYGNLVGPDLTYTNITENDSQLSGNPPVESVPSPALFGPPSLSPANTDDMSFTDMSFAAEAADGGLVYQNGELTFGVVANLGQTLQSLAFDEGGQWTLEGPPGDASVFASLVFDNLLITGVNGTPLSNDIVVAPTFSESFVPQSGPPVLFTPGPGTVTISTTTLPEGVPAGISVGTWDITADFNLAGALAGDDMNGAVTSVSVALDNTIEAQTTDVEDAVTLASIDKKHFIVTPVTAPSEGAVPEPASLSMLACGGLLLGRRRKTAR